MQKAAQRAENELGCYKLLTVSESEKVGSLMNQAQAIEMKIDEEVEKALALDDYISDINEKIRKINREQSRQNSVLDQCENSLNLKQDDVIQALTDCEVM